MCGEAKQRAVKEEEEKDRKEGAGYVCSVFYFLFW